MRRRESAPWAISRPAAGRPPRRRSMRPCELEVLLLVDPLPGGGGADASVLEPPLGRRRAFVELRIAKHAWQDRRRNDVEDNHLDPALTGEMLPVIDRLGRRGHPQVVVQRED